MLAIDLYSPPEIQQELAARAKNIRLALEYTQRGLAERSGVSLGTLKRFEHTGQISLESLLKISLVLGHLEDFLNLFILQNKPTSLDEMLKRNTKRKRGSHT